MGIVSDNNSWEYDCDRSIIEIMHLSVFPYYRVGLLVIWQNVLCCNANTSATGNHLADVRGAAISSPWDFVPKVIVIFFRFPGKGGT